ncbi:hypothetical protein ABPG75_008629 [Micractinium tetrahymenae]
MTLLAGSYERFLFGLRISQDQEGDEQQHQLARSFTHAAHKGVVKCIAAAGQWAATGGADDLIHLYDLKNDKDLGFLMSPGEGAVTALAFFTPAAAYSPTHMLSGSADGSLSVWAAGGGWESMKTMRGHRREVSAIAVHPSGLVALTTSRDCCLRMWDLVKGRCTYTSRLEAEAEGVAFCAEDGGERYALLCGARVTLHSVQGGEGVLCTLSHPRRVLCMAWAPGNRIVTGSEDGSLRLWDAQAGVELLCISRAHASRVRALTLVDSSGIDGSTSGGGGGSSRGSDSSNAGERLLVGTCSSDGSVKLWDLSKAAAAGVPTGASGGSCLAEAQTRARLTSLAAVDAVSVMHKRQAAAAARQQAARAAAAQQQGQQQGGSKKRKGDTAAVGAVEQAGGSGKKQRKYKAAGTAVKQQRQQHDQQQQQHDQQQQPGKAKGSKQSKGVAKPTQAAAPSGDAGVVVHDGVVEFLDSPQQAKKQKQKQAAVQQKRRSAAEQGKRFRSMPGEAAPQRQQGRGPSSARPKQRQQHKGKGGLGKFKPRR